MMFIVITIGSLLFLAVAYIIYNHHKCDFMDEDNNTDDGDNEFNQFDEAIAELERLNGIPFYHYY